MYINLGTALLKLYKFVESFCVKNNGDIKNCKCLSDITTQIECIGDSILLQETNKYNVDTILMDFVRFEFTRSLRLYDFCNRNHPKFEDYYVLLWNTQRFINIIGEYMTKSQISYYIDENKANRMLTPSNIDNAPFYFGRMFLKAAIGKYKDLSSLDKLVGKLDFVERDSSYVDRIGIDEYRLEIEEWMEKERMYEKIQKVKKFD